MAFVSRSERKIIISPSDKGIPGPGQYLRIPIMNMTIQSKAPFNSSFIKEKYIKEPSPGPGSYNIQIQQSKSTLDLSKAINTNTVHSTSDLNSTNQILIKNNKERLGFLTQVGRFNDNDSIKKAVSPNLLILLKPKEVHKPRKESKSMTSFMPLKSNNSVPGSIRRIVSIPSKDMRGYVLEKNGEALMILDSILNDERSNINCNETQTSGIGPGSYDISSKWKINALDWKKTGNNNEDSSKKETKYNLESFIKEFKRQGDFIPRIPNPEDKKQIYNCIHLRKKMNPLSIIEKGRKMSYITNTLSPGPGYYEKEILHDQLHTDDSQSPKYGCYASRFPNSCNSNISEETGPGSYFKPKNKYGEEKKYFRGLQYKSLYQINETIIEKNKKLKCSNRSSGPGSYEIQKGFIKGSLSNKELLKSGPQRFIPFMKREKRPGPGEYLDQNILSKLVHKEKTSKSLSSLFDVQQKKEKLMLLNQNSSSPPVGNYNSETYGTIQHENELRINRPQANIAPFLNTTNRFEILTNSSPVGPGAYLKDLMATVPKTTKDASFNNKEKRFMMSQSNSNSNIKVGPQDYDTNSNLDWNKRSFNVLFFKPKNNVNYK